MLIVMRNLDCVYFDQSVEQPVVRPLRFLINIPVVKLDYNSSMLEVIVT